MNEYHEMECNRITQSGATEWTCPICGYHFLMQTSPYKKVVLEAGNRHAIHSGGTGGVSMDMQIKQEPDNLQPFEKWAEKTDLDNL